MKRLLALLVLLSHMNTSMFMPQVQEQDIYDASGKKIDDINSVIEYIGVTLGIDHTADDEDDDTGQYFHVIKAAPYYSPQHIAEVRGKKCPVIKSRCFTEYKPVRLKRIALEIITPPPEFFS